MFARLIVVIVHRPSAAWNETMYWTNDRFSEVSRQASDDVSRVLIEHPMGDYAYQEYLPSDAVAFPKKLLRGQQKLIQQICANLPPFLDSDTRWEVQFLPISPIPFHHAPFASWLVVSYRRRQLKCFYDENIVDELGRSASLPIVREKLLAKTFLHECGHACLHLKHLATDDRRERLAPPSAKPEHEPEAWLYAFVVWGILVGEHARCGRMSTNGSDEGWRYA